MQYAYTLAILAIKAPKTPKKAARIRPRRRASSKAWNLLMTEVMRRNSTQNMQVIMLANF